jgi:predicted nucleotidyltransferase
MAGNSLKVSENLDLEKLDIQLIQNQISAVFKDFPEVIGVYLFGSAMEYCRPNSDIDIGVFVLPELSEREKMFLEGKISLRLEPLAGHPFDLTIIDPNNTIFAFRILKEGIILLNRNQEKLSDLIEKTSRDYCECSFRYQQAVKDILGEAGIHGA